MSEESLNTVHLRHCVERWQAGDRSAADELLQATGRRLEHLARKMLRGFPNVRDWAETGDVLQGSLMRLLNTLRNLSPPSTRDFFSLAALHVRRELLDLARYAAAQKGAPRGLPEGEIGAEEAGQPAAGDDLELWQRFHEEVERLPAEEREVVGLVFYHGWLQADIADLFGVDERTVRRRWQAACLKLNQSMGGDLPRL